MANASDPVVPLTAAELATIDHLNKTLTKDQIIAKIRALLETAITVELATIPIYLFAYYSINRKPTSNNSAMNPPGPASGGAKPAIPDSVDAQRAQELQIFANQAGAAIMSVAVEEMLHMSLSSNMLYAFGGVPELYRKSPGPPNGPHYPVDLPGHAKLGPDHKPMLIPLAPLSYEQLWKFLEIEWPETPGAVPEDANFKTIGQIYSYIRCLICTDAMKDYAFGATENQLQPEYYSPNNIDTIYPTAAFDQSLPAPRPGSQPTVPPSAAMVAKFEDANDSHAGIQPLLTIDSLEKAQQAIATICDQGEGYNPHSIDPDDDPSEDEESHYYKFLALQACLEKPIGYKEPKKGPKPPAPGIKPITPVELAYFVFPFPENPTTRNDEIPGGGISYEKEVERAISDALNGLYQYMLILTETSFKVSGLQQKKLFYQGMHMSMMWIMDKMIQEMRGFSLKNQGKPYVLAPTFENFDLGPRESAFATLKGLAETAIEVVERFKEYRSVIYYLKLFAKLPDVSAIWTA